MQQQQCVIKGCKKKGVGRLIHSDDPHYGWFCREHWSEIFEKNYIYLEGEGYDITIPHERFGEMICLSCSRGDPCGICGYVKNDKSQK